MLHKMVLTALILAFSANSYASVGGSSGQGKISYMYQRSFDGLLAVYKEDGVWDNPDGCDHSDRIVLTKANNGSRSEFYSALLAAQMANRNIKAYLFDCVEWNGVKYPKIEGLYTY